jgi:hypothetical protein
MWRPRHYKARGMVICAGQSVICQFLAELDDLCGQKNYQYLFWYQMTPWEDICDFICSMCPAI